MERAELLELMSPDGLRLLDGLPRYDAAADVVRSVADLRKAGHSPELVAAVLSQAKLRSKAAVKFGEFASRMLFTAAGLEQATRLQVAALHAGRFQQAGIRTVADLGCGIGGDAMAFSALGLGVQAVEADEITAAIAAYNLAPFPTAVVSNGSAEDHDLSGVGGVFLDPARRTAGHANTRRLTRPDDYNPSLTFAFDIAKRMPTGIKLGPGLDRELIPSDAEAQWVSVDGQLVEMGLWFGSLARQGISRSALVIDGSGMHELAGAADSADEPVGAIGDYLFEPDGAVIRARMIGDLARSIGARMVGDGIAYLTTDRPVDTPFATGFRVIETLPYPERELKRALRDRDIGTLEIKKRGVEVDPASLRARLSLRGTAAGTILLTRVAGRHTALLVERV
jgi:hypothetical protein